MLTINYNLRDKDATEATSIMLRCMRNGRRYSVSTGLRIHPKYWSPKQQKVREMTEVDGALELNNRLAELSLRAARILEEMERDEMLYSNEDFKTKLFSTGALNRPGKANSFWHWFEIFLDYKINSGIKEDGIKDYHYSMRKHLRQFELWNKAPLTINGFKNKPNSLADGYLRYMKFHAIAKIRNSRESLDEFIRQPQSPAPTARTRRNSFSGEPGLTINTIGKQIKNLKVFLNWCFDREICPPFSLRHLQTVHEDIDQEYLSEEELNYIEQLELDDSFLDEARDLFLFGCETGLRFSDLNSIRKEYIQHDRLSMHTQKTNTPVTIPLSRRAKAILEKRKNRLPQFKWVAQFNTGIRQVCELAGLDQNCRVAKTRHGKKVETWLPKYELISSHTCRRTFCTLKFLKGMRAHDIMVFSGHKSEKVFLRYLKIDRKLAVDRLRDFF